MRIPFNLIPSSRSLCALAAFACFASAAVLAPERARSQALEAPPAFAVPPPPAIARVAPVTPARDAFAPRAALDDEAPAPMSPPAVRTAMMFPPFVTQPGTALRLPAHELRVTAIASGPHPTAIVETEAGTRAVRSGDALAGSRVTAIDAETVMLANGRHLTLAQPAAP